MLASLTVDLNLALAKFEGDSGKAAQIFTRDQDKMTRGGRALTQQIERMAAAAGKSNIELLTIKAAAAGVGDATIRLAQNLGTASGAFAAVNSAGTQAFAGVSASADAVGARVGALLATMVEKTRELAAQSAAAKAQAVTQNGAGALTDDGLKVKLAAITAATHAEQQRLQVEYDANKATLAAAASEAAANEKRTAAFERLRATVAQLNYKEQIAGEKERTAAARAFVTSLETEAAAIGKTRSELLSLRAAQLGVSEQAAPFIARLTAAGRGVTGVGENAKLSIQQLQTLKYTLSDVVASLGSGASPLTVLLQQGGQVAQIEGGVSGLARGIVAAITPVRLAIGGVVGAVSVLGYALYEGSKQSRAFADSLVLTGNYAGITEGQFNALAKGIAASGQVSISSAREFTQALVSTGQVGPQVLGQAAEAAARYGEATGKSAKDVATQFATLNKDVYAGAKSLNESLNFLSATQIQQIRNFQDRGKTTEALSLVYDALNGRLKGLEPNLGLIDRALRSVTNTWRGFWDAAFDVGRAETIDQKLDKARARLVDAQRSANDAPSIGPYGGPRPSGASNVEARQEDVRLLSRSKAAQEAAAAATAANAELDKKAEEAGEYVKGFERRSKAASGLARELAEANRQFDVQDKKKAADPNYEVASAQTRAAILKKIREDYTDKAGAGEAGQVEKANRDKALKAIEESLQEERAAYAFTSSYLSGIYSSGQVSLEAFYAARRAADDADAAAQQEGFAKRIAALQTYLAKTKDPSDRITTRTQIEDAQVQAVAAEIERQRRATLAAQEEAAARRALTDRVVEYRAQLLLLQGDEAGAAALRAKQAIDAARLFAKQSGGLVSDADIANQAKALELANALAEAQRRVGFASADAAHAEEAYAIVASRVGASLYEQDTAVYAIRVKLVEQLKDAADKTKALADAERAAADVAGRVADPRILGAAADAALQYAKALDTIDPALNRLRDSAKSTADGIADNIGNAVNEFKGFPDLINNISKTIQQAGTKFFVTDPLKVGLENLFKQATEGDNPIGNFLKSAAGVGGGAGGVGLGAQTAAVSTSTSALLSFTTALGTATAALGGQAGASATVGSGGGIGSFFSRLFGGGSSGGATSTFATDDALALFFHSGGVVGSGGARGRVPASVFAGAQVLHSGGLAGLKSDEVPAILRRREEVIRRDDPRHRDNGGMRADRTVQANFYNSFAERTTRETVNQVAAKQQVQLDRAKRVR